MAGLFDHVTPGPAGLFFSCEELNESSWLLENEARQSLEHWCTYCGQSACYGYGVTLASEGRWSCSDADCRASGEAWMASRGKDEALPVEARKPAPEPVAEPVHSTTDLFGRAA